MPDKIESSRVLCSGGLNTSENFLLLSTQNPGMATRLVNYETSLTGGYRRITGYAPIDTDFGEVTSVGAPAEGKVLGIWGYVAINNTFHVYAARAVQGTSEYTIYRLTIGVGWTEETLPFLLTATNVRKLRTIAFTEGATNWIAWVDGINPMTLFDGTNYYQASSAGAGGIGDPGGNQMIDAPSLITYFKGTVFISGDASSPEVVAYSAPNDALTWTAASGGGQLTPGFPIQQVRPFRDENFIFGESKISKAIPDLAAGFTLQVVTTDIGCIAPDSVQELGGDLIFLSPDGIRPVAGTSKIGDTDLGLLSQAIQNTVSNAIVTYDLNDMVGVTIRSKTQFRYLFSSESTGQTDSYGLIGAVRTYGSDRAWEFGELLGIRASCAWSGYDEFRTERIYHGDYDGVVYKQESGTNFNGEPITAIYTLPYLDFGDPMVRKLMRKIHMFVRSEGTLTMDFSIKYDWDRDSVINPAGYHVLSDGTVTTYDGGSEWDDGSEYGGAGQPVFTTNIQGSGYAVQCSIVTSGIFSPYTIQGLVYEFSVKGRQL